MAAICEMFRSAYIEISFALKKRLCTYKDIITEIAPKLNLDCFPDVGKCIYKNEKEDIYVDFELYESWPGELVMRWHSKEWFSIDDYDLLAELIGDIMFDKYPQLNLYTWKTITSCEEWKTLICSHIVLKVDADPVKAKPVIYESLESLIPQLVEAVTLLRRFHNRMEDLPGYLEMAKKDKPE